MDIERARVKVTLKMGDVVYGIGHIFDKKDGQIPPDIISEIRENTGTVEVLPPVIEKEDPVPPQLSSLEAAKTEAAMKTGAKAGEELKEELNQKINLDDVPGVADTHVETEEKDSRLVG